MYRIRAKESFDGAHKIEGHQGKCANLHGHRWEVEVEVSAENLTDIGFVADFTDIKGVLKNILPDHQHLNEWWDFNPTAENIAKYIFTELEGRLNLRDGAKVTAVKVWEGPGSIVVYEPFDKI